LDVRIADRLERNIELLKYCGLSSLRRFTRRGSPITPVTLKNVGPVHLRLGDSDLATFTQVFEKREYDLAATGGAEQGIMARYRAIIEAGLVPIIIDAGANVGAATLWFMRRFPDAHIIAIEPEPQNAEVLRLNVAGSTRVTVLEAAIAGTAGTVSLAGAGLSWGVQTVRSAAGDLSAITMDQAVSRIPDGSLFLAKIDIEGFESDLFDGDLDWIDSAAVIIVEPHDWLFPGRGTSRTFQAAMGNRNFEIFISGENLIYVAADLFNSSASRRSAN